ncbi:hypothetical protein COCVIDRAFT_35279 [Bipolaris victoriae FI3]|uniref:Uncharacterized protein n=1 Tax=Bipolaris victoriae (strain FI3) TaxID=930091 RepID=W7F0Y0_BIPV3|nr:hypothetical protein COCVIDRAFT_35279 [Bipolaris victoriae FI3]
MQETRRDSQSGDVVVPINYFPATGIPIPKSAWKTPFLDDHNEHTRYMLIRDARTSGKTFDLDTNGFTFVTLPPKDRVTRESTEEEVKREYYPEVEEIVKKLTGATTAHVFNHVIRAHTSPSEKGILDPKGRWQDIPSGHPHVDYAGSPSAIAGTQLELSLPPHISTLFTSSRRFAFLGAWRPLKPVRRDPLAVCDATSVPDSDYQIRQREFSRTGIKSENYVMSHGEQGRQVHQWWYLSHMMPDEMVVFKGFDTERGKPGWRCPHTAFRVPGTEGEEARESIEVRVVVFWE